MFDACSINLREWISNSDKVNSALESKDKAVVESMKVMGHEWQINDDILSFKLLA